MDTDKIIAESIAKDYIRDDHSRLYALKKLDRKAKLPAVVFAYSFGILSSLVFGLGMCLSMGVVGESISNERIAGIIIGLIGMVAMGLNYPLYTKIMKKSKEKYSYEIIELAKKVCGK